MKKYFALFFTLISISVFSQNYKITYAFTLNIDADTIKSPEKKRYYNNYFLPEYKNTKGILWIKNNDAMFEQEGDLHKFLLTNDNYITTISSSKSHQKIYIESVIHQDIKHKYFHYTFQDFDWKITSETKKINGYTCYKATGTLPNLGVIPNVFEAWFCPEINLPFGPDNYAGLPGLIFEIYNTNGKGLHWTLQKIEKNKTKDFTIPAETDSEHFIETFKKFNEIKRKLFSRKSRPK